MVSRMLARSSGSWPSRRRTASCWVRSMMSWSGEPDSGTVVSSIWEAITPRASSSFEEKWK